MPQAGSMAKPEFGEASTFSSPFPRPLASGCVSSDFMMNILNLPNLISLPFRSTWTPNAAIVFGKMKSGWETLEKHLEAVEEDGANKSRVAANRFLTDALDRVREGKLGVDEPIVNMPDYPGLLGAWDFAREVRRALLASLDVAVKLAEDEARVTTATAVNKILQLGDQHLPDGVARNTRVFVPEAMFAGPRDETYGLDIDLAQRPDLLRTTFFDVFDVHQFSMHFGGTKVEVTDAVEANHKALGFVSVGIGGLTLVGGKTFDAWTLIEGIVRIAELLSNETVRKWVATVIGGLAIGATVYFVVELPNIIPRTVGRRIKASLVTPGADVLESQLFVNAHSARIGRETRKVLRLCSWDQKERFKAAMIERGKGKNAEETTEKKVLTLASWNPKERFRAATDERGKGVKDAESQLLANEHPARISRETRKVLRLASWDLKERFRVAMDERGKEVKDAEETEKKAMRALDYFQDMTRRIGEIREKGVLFAGSL
ncbi:hypothetical protein JAAARDRAFT_189422 [Jaapia argillacea MUCL 33604]|uniref:Uncharacterized protein n=1 Tax=Jaapia argillacea MUCL 33604 TaxID=933084 RepID=A0A067Q4R2_9AGAM|nr:hypothetical protein JAAARDRAFT_189422 [Jaapia argillacea MUCL 33604]